MGACNGFFFLVKAAFRGAASTQNHCPVELEGNEPQSDRWGGGHGRRHRCGGGPWPPGANGKFQSEMQQLKSDLNACRSVKKEQKRTSGGRERGKGGGVSVSLKREWGKGGREIMQARARAAERRRT